MKNIFKVLISVLCFICIVVNLNQILKEEIRKKDHMMILEMIKWKIIRQEMQQQLEEIMIN
jgi:hypothetical protein